MNPNVGFDTTAVEITELALRLNAMDDVPKARTLVIDGMVNVNEVDPVPKLWVESKA